MTSSHSSVTPSRPRTRLASVMALLAVAAVTAIQADEPELDAATKEVQGKWFRVQQMPDGPVRLLKEHRGNKTFLVAYDQKGNVLYAHESEFRVEAAGKVRILTFFNRKVTAGPDQGKEQKEPQSFLYRVKDEQFIETWGMLENDPGRPAMILWKRPDDRALGNEAAVLIPRR